jgi:superfamily I DNA and/or RNA helicase
MHPLLGQFVSKEFYEPYGEQFNSPLEEKYFMQDLAGTNGKPLMWLNVTNTPDKKEERHGTSRIRLAEIKVIGKQLKQWIDSEKAKDLNFGVISFYKAQTELMMEEFVKYGLTVRNAGGKLEIAKEYQMFGKEHKKYGEERLRIGTADAFQGKEFDVVFLSMVRTLNPKFKELQNEQEEEKMKIATFGHLVSKNRLCVSMSRQKRLLVVVGDAALVETSFAKKSVPEMFYFLELCKKEGVYQ